MSYYDQLLKKPKVYLTPMDLLKDAVEYFNWAVDHPLLQEKVFKDVLGVGDAKDVKITRTHESKMRSFTKSGMATHLSITVRKFNTFKNRGDDWAEVVERIEQAIRTQKFEGAAAGQLNAMIISRDLGLAEKQEVKAETIDLTPQDSTPEEHRAIHTHPDDPDPTGVLTGVFERPLFSKSQLDSGIAFHIG